MCTSIELPDHPIESPFAKDIPLRCNDTLPFLQFSTQPILTLIDFVRVGPLRCAIVNDRNDVRREKNV